MKSFDFYKMTASGNDFIVIDNHRNIFPDKDKKLIQRLCALHTGIGADGILLLEKSSRADFKMRIFNPDGSEPSMCGNGARCIGIFAWTNKVIPRRYSMETLAGTIKGEIVSADKVKIFLGKPKDVNLNRKIKIKNKTYIIHTINTGVPHVIMYVSNINKPDVEKTGRFIRRHRMFQPQGANVDFVKFLGKSCISVRTYERGVEAETLACGTGVAASAIVSALLYKMAPVINVKTKSGETLFVDTEEISLTGNVKIVFNGTFILK